jgi:hypothetical protein
VVSTPLRKPDAYVGCNPIYKGLLKKALKKHHKSFLSSVKSNKFFLYI